MSLAEDGDLAKSAGDMNGAQVYYFKAYELERNAAIYFLRKLNDEPTRSVLFRSAASLALQCKLFREAEQLICQGLAGDPPPELRVELRELYEQVHFQLFLDDSGLELAEGQVVVTLWGDQIAPGFASCREVIRRLSKTERLIYRTAARKIGITYDDRAEPSEEVRRNFKVYASLPMAASYAVVLRIAERDHQLALPFSVDAATVVSELLECMDLYNQEKIDQLQTRIGDGPYLRNFMSLAHDLYPSTPDVSRVGFAGITASGEKKTVELGSRPSFTANQLGETLTENANHGLPIRITGILNFAASQTHTRHIKLKEASGKSHKIDVPEGMMADVVRPYFEARVIADVTKYPDGSMRLEHVTADETTSPPEESSQHSG